MDINALYQALLNGGTLGGAAVTAAHPAQQQAPAPDQQTYANALTPQASTPPGAPVAANMQAGMAAGAPVSPTMQAAQSAHKPPQNSGTAFSNIMKLFGAGA